MARVWNAVPEPGKSFADLFPELAAEWHRDNNEHQPTYYKRTSGDKVWWLCSVCSHEWPATIANRTVRNSGCPACSGHVLHVNKTNSLLYKLPEIARQMHPTKNGNLQANELMPGARAVVWWLCDTCDNEWDSAVASRKRGRGCPACAGKGIHSDGRNTIAAHPILGMEFIPERNPKIDPAQTLSQTKRKIWWRCSMCDHEWPTRGQNRISRGSGCPNCQESGFNPDVPGYYYVIKIQNGARDVLYKGGITDDLPERFNAHKRKFSKSPETSHWVLQLSESIYFEVGAEARELESKLLGIREIRAPNIKGVSRELFLFDPLEFARNKGMLGPVEGVAVPGGNVHSNPPNRESWDTKLPKYGKLREE